ncbi:MAG: hypothetical protein ABUK16_02380, partial [Anaerolineales bacterium]
MTEDIRALLQIPTSRLDAINQILANPDMKIINDFLEVVAKYGTPEEINAKAEAAKQMSVLREKVAKIQPDYLKDLDWLQDQREKGAFISIDEYRKKVLGERAEKMSFNDDFAVTLEISACQYFPYVMLAAKRAIAEGLLMPSRFIRVRQMKEQEDDGDLPAFAAAMQIIGASYVETLDTKGTDGSNVHLGGPETITGYFGGV